MAKSIYEGSYSSDLRGIIQKGIDMLFEEHVLTPVTFMRFLKSRSIDLFPDDVEEILHLRKGTLDVEETKPRIVRLKLL